ncbi:GEVED domain-containing protein [Draconibacterium mangrovi]|uniref:GEVED domain-containing protein n=1 Tax=Draconibacterium mangrovi TaxID=2697469 RepID=UPI0013D8B1C0|nr:GEVED domain-containing protein [Draconibacterium mangrovi]
MKTKLLLTVVLLAIVTTNAISQENSLEMKAPQTWTTDPCGMLMMLPTFDYNEFIANGGSAYSDCGIVESSLNNYFNTYYDEFFKKLVIETVYTIMDSCSNTLTATDFYMYRPTTYIPDDVITNHQIQQIEEIDSITGLPFSDYNQITPEEFIAAGGFFNDVCGMEPINSTIEYQDWNAVLNENGLPESFIRIFSIFDEFSGLFYTMEQQIVFNDPNPVVLSAKIIPPYNTFINVCNNEQVIPVWDYQEFEMFGGKIISECPVNETSFTSSMYSFYDEFWDKFMVETAYFAEYNCGNNLEYFDYYLKEPFFTIPEDIHLSPSDGDFANLEALTTLPLSLQPKVITSEQFQAAGGSFIDTCYLEAYSYIQIEYNDYYSYPYLCPISINRVFTIIDDAGVFYSKEQQIIIEDKEAPVLQLPNDTVLSCADELPEAFLSFEAFEQAGGTASDNGILMKHSFSLLSESTDGSCPKTVSRTYEIQDTCGNTTYATQLFMINDTLPPVITGSSNIFIECTGDIPANYNSFEEFAEAGGTADDNCEIDYSSFRFVGETITGNCPTIINRFYEIGDACANTSLWQQQIIVNDTTPPFFLSLPQTINDINFDDEFPLFESLEYDDNCGTPELSTTVLPFTINEAGYPVTYLWALTDSCGNTAQTSTSFNVLPKPVEYCTATANASNEWIAEVNIGGQTNSSGAAGYEDFTAFIFKLTSAESYTITLTPGLSGKATFEYWSVWIDLNTDGTFSDNELLFSANKKRSIVTGSITIPNVNNLETRMRVAISSDGSPLPCGNIGNGEVEDYTVVIGAAVPQPPVAAFSSDKTVINAGEAVQFYDESLNNPDSWEWSFPGADSGVSTEQNPAVIYNTEGIFDVILWVTNDVGTDSLILFNYITVNDSITDNYCDSESLSIQKEWIAGVNLGDISNASEGSAYSDFTSINTNLATGAAQPIQLSPGFSGKSEREFWKVWIDFNQDKDFDDAGEEVLAVPNSKSVVSANISVPADALPGTTRMRVAMKANAYSSSCEIFDRGEVEDYSVTIISNKSAYTEVKAAENEDTELIIYPNPAHDIITISHNIQSESTITVFNAYGAVVKKEPLVSNLQEINISNLSSGSYYIRISGEGFNKIKKFIKQ